MKVLTNHDLFVLFLRPSLLLPWVPVFSMEVSLRVSGRMWPRVALGGEFSLGWLCLGRVTPLKTACALLMEGPLRYNGYLVATTAH